MIAAVLGPRGKLTLVLVLFAAFFCWGTSGAQAAFICWSNPSGGNWSNAANWRGGVIPGPGDEAILNGTSGGCNLPATVTVDTDVSVGVLSSPFTKVEVAPGKTLAVVGKAEEGSATIVLGAGSKLHVPTGAVFRPTGAIEMSPTSEFNVEGTVRPINGFQTVGGTVNFNFESKVILDSEIMTLGNPNTTRTKVNLQGTVDMSNGYKGGIVFLYPTADSPSSDATWTGPSDSLIAARFVNGTSFEMSGPISVGRLELTDGTLHLTGNKGCSMGNLKLFSPASIYLDSGRSCNVSGELDMSNEGQFGGRRGPGTLTAATAEINAGLFDGGGLTRITGGAALTGNGPTYIRGGATLRTEGASAWERGFVQLGAPGEGGTWENAGTLRVTNGGGVAPTLTDGGGSGVLRNLAGASLVRAAPTGEFTAGARIENAGTIDVQAGSFGKAGDAGTVVQSGGVTHVAAGATLDQGLTMSGGVLSGGGTVREVVNSGGTVAPGDSPGTLTVAGPYTQGAGGTLETELSGTAPGAFDQLHVGGAATLGGTVKIVRDPSFTPALADTFKVVQSASRTGEFATLAGDTSAPGDLVFGATYQGDGATLCFAGGGLCPGTPPPSNPGGGGTQPTNPGGSGGSGSSGSGSSGSGSSGSTTKPGGPAAPKTVSIASIASLSLAKLCVNRRSFKLKLKPPKGMTVASAEIEVGSKAVEVKGKKLTSEITLSNLPQGKFVLQITLTATDGSQVTGTQSYPACTSKPKHKKKKAAQH